MAYFRIALVNLSSWFLRQCYERRSMSLARFLHNVLLMPVQIELTKDVRHIRLERNPKDPECMDRLLPALQRLNDMNIRQLDGNRIAFSLP